MMRPRLTCGSRTSRPAWRAASTRTSKEFTANVPDGAIGKIELQATSGPDLRLPVGIDGLLLEDHDE